jgi:glycosyltransferase involved in cell wall biosynthesis
MQEIKVSVITPVYNADAYLRRAVESAVSLEEVGEILLIEDNSPDNSLRICEELAEQYPKVRVLQHPMRANRGAGESRNLGVRNASYEIVAFLDADDWYLPNRFESERTLLLDSEIDGVYGATGYYYEDEQRMDPMRLTTLQSRVAPRDLLLQLLSPSGGRFTTDSITVRKALVLKAGLFDQTLRLHQDTHLWLRLAFLGRLEPGQIDKAVAVRRVHSKNRITKKDISSRNLLYVKTFESFLQYSNVPPEAFRIIFKRYITSTASSKVKQFMKGVSVMISNPSVFRKFF